MHGTPALKVSHPILVIAPEGESYFAETTFSMPLLAPYLFNPSTQTFVAYDDV